MDLTLSPYFKFKRLTAEDGFSSVQTWSLAQDKRGFMWFGTADGLNRYDGASVKVNGTVTGCQEKILQFNPASQSAALATIRTFFSFLIFRATFC